MKKVISGLLASVFCASSLLGLVACKPKLTYDEEARAFSDPDVTLSVDATTDASKAENHISDTLFGLFLEDINYASLALDDNFVANGSFNKPGTKAWTMEQYWKTENATLDVVGDSAAEKENRVFETNTTFARVSAQANGKLINLGYEAVPYAVETGVDYKFSAFIRNTGNTAFDLTVKITDGSSWYGDVKFNVAADNSWVKYERTFNAPGTASKGLQLELIFGAAATVDIDNVTFETTDSTVGIKNFMYDALRYLNPSFFRFPGGCIIEGGDINSAYDWKNSIGAVKGATEDSVPAFNYKINTDGTTVNATTYGELATRTPNDNLWNVGNAYNKGFYYTMDYSIGFYEYFLLCESLTASAVPIVNAGLDCQIQAGDSSNGFGTALVGRYGNGTSDYIQDALDLVAFAKGDPNSSDAHEAKWATVRKNMGHEEPFEMDYLGVGNEQWSERYYEYYAKFLEAFKEAAKTNPLYGSVKLIVGNGPNFDQCETFDENGKAIPRYDDRGNVITSPASSAAKKYLNVGDIDVLGEYGVVDHHYYMGYVDFFANTHFYDNYSRDEFDRYEIFVGEYSANSNAQYAVYMNPDEGDNTWLSALSEAAYMTGLERNGDIVKLAAYAPMYGVASGTEYTAPNNHWKEDMMYFTNTSIVLTPNYYVQQIFMMNAGTLKVKSAAFDFGSGSMPTTTFEGKTAANNNASKSVTVDNLYQIVSVDESSGDIIVKVVNAGEEGIRLNVAIKNAKKITGIVNATFLECEKPYEKSTLEGDAVSRRNRVLGLVDGDKFGYKLAPYSVSVFRIRTK